MNEQFYEPPIPQPRRIIRGGGRYSFRQPQTQVNPLALRKMQLQEVTSRRREEIAVGHQELEAMKQMAHLEQQEFAIRQQIAKERQVSSAQREVAKLDPENDPHYAQKYAEVMAKHPMAQGNKFLNEAFTEGSRINYRVSQHKFNELEEGQKQAGREELAWIKASGTYAAMGGDPSAFTDKDGNHDWNALNSAHAKAVRATKEAAAQDSAGLPITKTVTKEGNTTVTREAPKAAKPELTMAQKINLAKMEGTHTGQLAQQEIFQKQMNDSSIKDKSEVKKNLDIVTANLALSKAQIDAVHGVVSPQILAPATPLKDSRGAGAAGGAAGVPKTSAQPAPAGSTPSSPVSTIPAAPDAPKPQLGSWEDITAQMESARGRGDAARARRMTAMDTLSKLSFVDNINPFNTKLDDAQKVMADAETEMAKHDADYKELFDKRMEMARAAAPGSSTPAAPVAAAPATEKPPLSDLIKF